MLKKIFSIMVIFSTLLVGGCDSGPKITPLDQSSTILAFGDSLTHGTGAPDGQAYPDVLSSLLGIPVINVGIPGETTSQGVKRLPGVLDQYKPTLVILCEGGNDFLRRHNEQKTVSNLREMIEAIQSRGIELIFVGVPKLGFGLAVPQFYDELAEQYGLPYEGEILVDLLGDRSVKSDEIHPNAIGYRLMAEAIHDVIEDAQK
jgi:lysophospholipase L1-like esterase